MTIHFLHFKKLYITWITGYRFYADFLAGALTGTSKISWSGKHKNLSYTELEDLVISSNYSDLEITNAVKTGVFILPYGYCYRLTAVNNKQKLEFNMKEHAKLIMIEKNVDNKISIQEKLGFFS